MRVPQQMLLGGGKLLGEAVPLNLLEKITHPTIKSLVAAGKIHPNAGLAHGTEEVFRKRMAEFAAMKALLNKTAKVKSPVLKDLLNAKKLSDHNDYSGKNLILAKLLRMNPADFHVDSELNEKYIGLTHKPTGFKIHAPRSLVPVGVETKVKKAAQTILVAGHSGAGKSTLAAQLAERLGGIAYQIDDYPEFAAQVKDNTGLKERLAPGTPENKKYMAMLQRAVQHTLSNVAKDKPAVVEGAQFSVFPKAELLKYPRIYVGGKVEQSIQQRIARSLAKEKAKGNEVTEEELKGKHERTKLVVKQWHDGLMEFRALPGTLRYNHSHNDLDALVARLKKRVAGGAKSYGKND